MIVADDITTVSEAGYAIDPNRPTLPHLNSRAERLGERLQFIARRHDASRGKLRVGRVPRSFIHVRTTLKYALIESAE